MVTAPPDPYLTSPGVRADPCILADPSDWPAAVAATDGPQMVLAGPGTGKTEFLARRVAHLLASGVAAHRVLVLTFSRRAAAELEQRISSLLPRPVSGATASTFHSFAHRLVETHRHTTGGEMPVLLTGPEQVRLVGRLLSSEDPAAWPATFRPLLATATLADEVADFVMRCHERLLDPTLLERLAQRRADWRALPPFLARYEAELEKEGKVDYGRLIAEAVATLEDGKEADGSFDYVIVDEYQDTSPAQARLATLASGDRHNITVAADPHQSIYSFRGADLENVDRFPREMAARGAPVEQIVLGRSFRVPPEILDAARRLVAPNRSWEIHGFETEPAAHGGTVDAFVFDQRSAEAEWIASEVERLHYAEAVPFSSMAVVVRSTRHLLPELSRALDRRRIPHDRPDTRLVDHPAIRLVADVVESALVPAGSTHQELAVRRLLLGPLFALPLGTERELQRRHRRSGESWPTFLRRELPEAAPLAELMENAAWATDLPAVDGFWHLWDRLPGLERLVTDPDRAEFRVAWSTYSRMLERQAERDATISLAESLAATTTGDFEASPQLRHSGPSGDRLVVTTLHQAKGLEFEVVFIADATEGVFPDTRKARSLLQPQLLSPALTNDPAAQSRSRLDEERRLAYTATTRARRRVVWTATTAGIDEGERRPSRFILAATGRRSFDDVTAPVEDDSNGFSPLTRSGAEAMLRRILVDPHHSAVDRLAALAALASHPAWDPTSFAGVPEPGPDTGVIRGKLRLSPSQAMLYDQCPRRYALERRLHAVEAESPYLQFGSLIHEVLEDTEKEAVEAGEGHGDLTRALEHLDRVWERYPPFGPPPVDEAWRRRGEELLAGMYADWPGGDDEAVALEMALDTTIDGIEWVGRADRIDRTAGGLKIVDYKTTRNPPTLKDVGSSLQLGYYILAAATHPDLAGHGAPAAAEMWYPLARGDRKVYPFQMKNLDSVRQALVDVGEGIRSESWETRIGSHCARCPFRGVCPAWPDGREAYR